jgi:hypothetical protein
VIWDGQAASPVTCHPVSRIARPASLGTSFLLWTREAKPVIFARGAFCQYEDRMQGFACAGPKGVCLVARVEVRGADDLKVVARVIK